MSLKYKPASEPLHILGEDCLVTLTPRYEQPLSLRMAHRRILGLIDVWVIHETLL